MAGNCDLKTFPFSVSSSTSLHSLCRWYLFILTRRENLTFYEKVVIFILRHNFMSMEYETDNSRSEEYKALRLESTIFRLRN